MTIHYSDDKDKVGRIYSTKKPCKYCSKLITCCLMSNHLRLKHDNEVFRY